MSTSNGRGEFAAVYCRTHGAAIAHEQAKSELKSLVPEDAKEAFGHGVRAKRSKSGAVSFDLAGLVLLVIVFVLMSLVLRPLINFFSA